MKALYWHVAHMSAADREAGKDELLGIAGSTEAKTTVEANWLEAEDVGNLNFRMGIDPLATAYVLGRAKSAAEKQKALAEVSKVPAIKRVVDYVELRP